MIQGWYCMYRSNFRFVGEYNLEDRRIMECYYIWYHKPSALHTNVTCIEQNNTIVFACRHYDFRLSY